MSELAANPILNAIVPLGGLLKVLVGVSAPTIGATFGELALSAIDERLKVMLAFGLELLVSLLFISPDVIFECE